MPRPSPESLVKSFLRPYQRRWLEDSSPRKICLKSRRIGFSEVVLLDALLDALRYSYRDVYLCSTSYTNAKELLRRLSRWLEVFARLGYPLPIARQTTTIVEFDNGSRIIPFPAEKVRSRTGTVVLDEFAFWQRDRHIWSGIAPVADTDPNMRLLVVSTPFGASGMFYELWQNASGQYGSWSTHEIDIYGAADEGFPVDPEELKQRYPSDIWQQEFCCQFLSDINQYFSHDLIRSMQYDEDDVPEWNTTRSERYAGIDVASSRDGSVFVDGKKELLEVSSGTPADRASRFWVGLVETIKQAGERMDYTPQFRRACELLDGDAYRGVGVDATGEGAQLGQDLRREYNASVIHEIKGSQWKEVYDLVPQMRLDAEQGRFRIPHNRKLRNAFTKIQRIQATNGEPKFVATRDAEGHADEFSATLLAYYASKRSSGGNPLNDLPDRNRDRSSRKADRMSF